MASSPNMRGASSLTASSKRAAVFTLRCQVHRLLRSTMSANILIIDDDVSIRDVLSDVLNDEGYSVQIASNGVEGLRSIDQSLPTLILLDMRMPVLDGWGFTRM